MSALSWVLNRWRWRYVGEAWDVFKYGDTDRQVSGHWTLVERGNGERRVYLAPTQKDFDRTNLRTRPMRGSLDAWIHGGPLPGCVSTPSDMARGKLVLIRGGKGGDAA
jgi:hypothetical protein